MMTQETEKVRKQMQIVRRIIFYGLLTKQLTGHSSMISSVILIPTEWVDQVLIPLRLLRYLLFNTCMESKACGRQSKRLK